MRIRQRGSQAEQPPHELHHLGRAPVLRDLLEMRGRRVQQLVDDAAGHVFEAGLVGVAVAGQLGERAHQLFARELMIRLVEAIDHRPHLALAVPGDERVDVLRDDRLRRLDRALALRERAVNDLLEVIGLVADLQDLKANPDREAYGTIIESKVDKGRGNVATVLVQTGTLKVGDIVTVGKTWGRVRALQNAAGRRVKEAEPATAVEMASSTA